MDAGMVVNVVVYPVAPGSSPAVLAEQFFHHCRRIQIVWEGNRCSIEYEGPTGIVRNYSVVLEFESVQFANANQSCDPIRRWPREAGCFFSHFLQCFENGHSALSPIQTSARARNWALWRPSPPNSRSSGRCHRRLKLLRLAEILRHLEMML